MLPFTYPQLEPPPSGHRTLAYDVVHDSRSLGSSLVQCGVTETYQLPLQSKCEISPASVSAEHWTAKEFGSAWEKCAVPHVTSEVTGATASSIAASDAASPEILQTLFIIAPVFARNCRQSCDSGEHVAATAYTRRASDGSRNNGASDAIKASRHQRASFGPRGRAIPNAGATGANSYHSVPSMHESLNATLI